MVEYCSWRRHGGHGGPPSERTLRPADRRGCVWCYRCSPDSACASNAQGRWTQQLRNSGKPPEFSSIPMKEIVGTSRLELLTSTVSNLEPVRDDATPKKSE